MGNWLKTLALTVNCPYCQTGYVFRKPELKEAWDKAGRADPLHAECKQAKREHEKGKYS